MKKYKPLSTPLLLISFFALTIICDAQNNNAKTVDVCVYGGTSAGVIAAYTAKKMGKSVILVEPGSRLGGLTSGGLGQTDIGNKYAVTGICTRFLPPHRKALWETGTMDI